MLQHFEPGNAVHERLKANLGQANFDYLSKTQVLGVRKELS